MIEPWNDKSISLPPINTIPCQIKFNVNNLTSYCKSIIYILSKQSPLHKESAILSRFLYKFDKKFRNDIGYRNFKKVNTALRRYLSLNIAKDVQSFVDLLPANNESDSYLPTKQMLEYILIRLMTLSKLMYRIAVNSKQAAIFYLDRIKRGQSHWMSLMPYALLSRVWSMVLVLLQHSCIWYNQLYPFLKDLPYKGLNFLPKDYKLPVDLEEWVDMKNLNQSGRFEWTNNNKLDVNVDSSMIDCDDGFLSESILKYVSKIYNETDNCDETEGKLLLPSQKEKTENVLNNKYDYGIAISRESFKQSLETKCSTISVSKSEEQHTIENVADRDDLKKFLENEELFRNQSNDLALTKHLSFMQWQALKTSLLKLDSALINRNKLEKKIIKVWQQKCLEYL